MGRAERPDMAAERFAQLRGLRLVFATSVAAAPGLVMVTSSSNAAPCHPSSAKPNCPQTPASPGRADAPSATSSPDSCADPPA